jgi:exosome complex component RRP43
MSISTSSIDASLAVEAEALKAATFRRLHPRLYLERFLVEGVRTDGRAENEFRDVAVNVGMFHGFDVI